MPVDPPARKSIPRVGPSRLPQVGDLDGLYVWLGPSGAGGYVDGDWDSMFGGDLAVMRVREHAPLGAIGVAFGGSKWTVRDGGRLWIDALLGTRVLGKMLGVSAGPLVELAELAHPRLGAALGIWGFVGVTPFVRVGAIQDLGMFGEIGIHIALPVLRRR